MVIDELKNSLRQPKSINGYNSRLSAHEAIKAQLYVLGYRLHYTPILEAAIPLGRMDCLYFRNGFPACGIEVDYSIKAKSIKKLLTLPADTEKIIISYGRLAACSRAIHRHRSKLEGIKHFLLPSISG